MLAGVQHQEQLTALQISDDRVDHRFAAAVTAPEHGGDGVRHEMGSLHRCQLHQPGAVAERVHQVRGNNKCKLGFAAAACPSKRHQAPRHLPHQVANHGAVLVAPDQMGVRRWQVVVTSVLPAVPLQPLPSQGTGAGRCRRTVCPTRARRRMPECPSFRLAKRQKLPSW